MPLSTLSFLYESSYRTIVEERGAYFYSLSTSPARVPSITLVTSGLNLLALIAITTQSKVPATPPPQLLH